MTIPLTLRKKELLYTIITNFLLQIITAITGFILPPLIISTFGSSVNGMVSSINQFIIYLNLVEAGVGEASIVALYKPLATNDEKERNAILSATRKFYNRSGILFIMLITILAVVYPIIVGDEVSRLQAAEMVLVLGITVAAEYFLTGKYRVLLTADRKVYYISIVQIITVIISAAVSVLLINLGFNIVIVKFISAVVFLSKYLFFRIYIHKKYKNINFHTVPDTKAISQSKNVLIHQFGSLIICNLPLVLITFFCSLKEASVYTIYAMVFSAVGNLLGVLSNGITSFFGESLAKDNISKTIELHRKYEILYFMAISWCFSMAYLLIMPFMNIYTINMTDANYIQPVLAFLFVIEGVLNNIRVPGGQLVCGAGHYKQTQKQLFIEVILRFVFSLVFTIRFGMIGVLMGGVISYGYRAFALIIYPCKVILQKSSLASFMRIGLMILFTALAVKCITNFGLVPENTYKSWFLFACVYGIVLGISIIIFVYITRKIPDKLNDFIYRLKVIRINSKSSNNEENNNV